MDVLGWFERMVWYTFLSVMVLMGSFILKSRHEDPNILALGVLAAFAFFFPSVVLATLDCIIKPLFDSEQDND